MNPKIIKSEEEYAAALEEVARVMSADPDTPDGDALELWSMLVSDYEERVHPVPLPDPISAIRFRMEQNGLNQADLVPYFGSKSKVSEVLRGLRPLSLGMIRKLHEGLGIPAEVLLQEPGGTLSEKYREVDWRRYPLSEIIKRQWLPGFRGTIADLLDKAEELLGGFLFPEGLEAISAAYPRQNRRSGASVDEYALQAWMARVFQQAAVQDLPPYAPGTVDETFIRETARLSRFATGPLLAQEALLKQGIHFVVERHLPGTHLDGMVTRCADNTPVVALTLRYDRLDNFWFTLCHELAHIARHLEGDKSIVFVDDLEVISRDGCEEEADRLAAESLIPSGIWETFHTSHWTEASVVEAANRLRLDPSIIAGRIRRETGNYQLFSHLIGSHKVRKLFRVM